jgi:DNA-directed RNA polymerase specialized sigma24 family protein
MASTPNDPLDIEQALRGLLALQVAEREERMAEGAPRRTELILADAGLSFAAIASVTGKKRDSIRKTVERARKRPASAGDDD